MNWNYEDGRIYSINENGELMAEATYVRKDNAEVDINRTYVNPVLRGQGIAGNMMVVVAEYLRGNKLKATATCPYADNWLQKNKESYLDIIA